MMLKIFYILKLIERKKFLLYQHYLLALGFTKAEIVDEFYEVNNIHLIQKLKNGKQNLIQKIIKQKTFQRKLLMQKLEKVVIKLGDKIN